MTTVVVTLTIAVPATIAATLLVVRGVLAQAEDAEKRARAIRDQAARIEVSAAWHETAARALVTDTASYQVVKPSVRVLLGMAMTEASEWARNLGPDRAPTWGEGELKQLAEKPPLRTKSGLPARARRWWFPDQSSPTPLLMARLPHDPTRRYRVRTVQ